MTILSPFEKLFLRKGKFYPFEQHGLKMIITWELFELANCQKMSCSKGSIENYSSVSHAETCWFLLNVELLITFIILCNHTKVNNSLSEQAGVKSLKWV